MMDTARLNAQPRFCWSPRTVTRCRLLVALVTTERIEAMYVVLVPVKPPAIGKSRLAGLPDEERRSLAAAFALDTVTACQAASSVAALLAVTDDASFSRELAAIGCESIPDGVAGDLNGTLRLTASEARRRWPHLTPVALCADLPALQPQELDAALDGVQTDEAAYVADADGHGTTLYTAAYDAFEPQFGNGSAAAHRSGGARAVGGELAGLRRDVDDLEDLQAALALGVGPRTRQRATSLVGDGPSAS